MRRISPELRRGTLARVGLGERPVDLAQELGISRSTICKWRKATRDSGEAAPAEAAHEPLEVAPARGGAGAYSSLALGALVAIMTQGKSEASRIAAANAILDRAHGKPRTPAEPGEEPKPEITRIERVIVYPER